MIRATSLPTPHQTAFTNGSHEAVADVPVEKGGAGQGFGPHELLEAALATCIVMTARMFAEKHALALTAATCAVRADRDVPGAVTLWYTLSLEGTLSDVEMARVREAVGHCPVARTLTGLVAVRPEGALSGPAEPLS